MDIQSASKKWALSARKIQNLCKDGAISGAKKINNRWFIPNDAPNPSEAERINSSAATWDDASWNMLIEYLRTGKPNSPGEFPKTNYRPSEIDAILKSIVSSVDLTFSEALLSLIDNKGLNDVQVYKKAGIDRRLFSKIRSSRTYTPSLKTAVRLSLALELNAYETINLLQKAGLALTKSKKENLVIMYCIGNQIFAIDDVNMALRRLNLEEI